VSRLASRATALRIVIGRLIGEVREPIGRVFRIGECLRAAGRLLGQAFPHRSREPLARALIDHVTAAEWVAGQQLDARTAAEELGNGVVDGCFPRACRGESQPVRGRLRAGLVRRIILDLFTGPDGGVGHVAGGGPHGREAGPLRWRASSRFISTRKRVTTLSSAGLKRCRAASVPRARGWKKSRATPLAASA